ncbi:MAG TPA: KEOPS complex subunit Cgi121 [Nitrososphaeraceae archaeon]|jgi:tRNA threonylcarbamoyladenosine modification (KEOPS) complex Cgi121 subunit|nr:KEOPS complex subunit Cgi121 [Nitrososphaeraceae archaeon]
MRIFLIGDTFYSIVGVQKIKVKNIGEFLEDLRNVLRGVSIQALDANIVYGIEHIHEVLKITLEAINRKIIFANKAEIDLLLRLSYTNQISMAVKYGGLKNGSPGCLIFFSKDKTKVAKAKSYIENMFSDKDNTIINASTIKRKMISEQIGISSNKLFDDQTFIRYLIERACLIMK